LAQALRLEDQVRFLGFVPEEDLPELYRASDLFVLCTREAAEQQEVEGFGLVFLEAQACGTPVVGTRTGGIPDAIREGEGGWLIEQDDAVRLAQILKRLAADPEQFRTAGLRARQHIERECAWSHYLDHLAAALTQAGVRLD
jgi:phosphatidylinositol alpha-1,6-mannosyltransferase